jgi:histone H3/H4
MSEMNEGAEKKEQGPQLLIVQSKVRDEIRAKEKRVSDEFITALSEHVRRTIEKAVARATANGRSTLRPEDI